MYRLHKWLDERELLKFFLLLMSIGVPNSILALSNSSVLIFIALSMFLISLPIYLTRINYISGKWEFNKSIYKLPEVGDVFVMEKTFWWDGGFRKLPPHGPGSKPNYWIIKGKTEWRVTDIKASDCDWKIYLSSLDDKYDIYLKYFESRGYWKTKSDIRNGKLSELGI